MIREMLMELSPLWFFFAYGVVTIGSILGVATVIDWIRERKEKRDARRDH